MIYIRNNTIRRATYEASHALFASILCDIVYDNNKKCYFIKNINQNEDYIFDKNFEEIKFKEINNKLRENLYIVDFIILDSFYEFDRKEEIIKKIKIKRFKKKKEKLYDKIKQLNNYFKKYNFKSYLLLIVLHRMLGMSLL